MSAVLHAHEDARARKIIPIRLSHSTLETLNSCERKFQLDKLLQGGRKDESEHTVFGRAYGVGIASYLVTQDADRSIFEAWLAYWPELETEKKNIPRLVSALEASFVTADTLLMEYEVATFNGRPAVELSFRLNINEHYYFVGYIDVVLRNRFTGVYYVLDAKTTGLQLYDLEPLYKHSGQTLGYSVALDRIVGSEQSSYGVLYFVAQLGKEFKAKTHVMPFNKTLLDRLNWFVTLGMDVKHLTEMAELNIYPKRHSGCLRYNKACMYFGTCHLHSMDIPKIPEEDLIEYDFVYELEELIQSHLDRIKKMGPIADITSNIDGIEELV
jgi:hypothetical protein